MRPIALTLLTLLPLAFSLPPAPADDGRAADDAHKPPGDRPVKVLNIKGVRVDLGRKELTFPAKVVERSAPLELIVCHAGTKEHESILSTKVRPANVHAGLLALGLTPGLAARWEGTGENARFQPPRGPQLKIHLRWKDKQGKACSAEAGDWLKPFDREGKPPAKTPDRYVFIGSRLLPDDGYQADATGEIVSLVNFPSAVLDVPFESTQANDLLEYKTNTEAIPAVGTAVEVVLTPVPGAEKSPYARAVIDIDRAGRIRANGQPVPSETLEDWVGAFLTRHPEGVGLVRAQPGALVEDVRRALEELWMAGLKDYEVERIPSRWAPLPRTEDQAAAAMRNWQRKFDPSKDPLIDPDLEARATLERISSELETLEARMALLKKYQAKLRAAREAWQATTRPAE